MESIVILRKFLGGIFMEIKGIDVSAWQGNIDWKTAKIIIK